MSLIKQYHVVSRGQGALLELQRNPEWWKSDQKNKRIKKVAAVFILKKVAAVFILKKVAAVFILKKVAAVFILKKVAAVFILTRDLFLFDGHFVLQVCCHCALKVCE